MAANGGDWMSDYDVFPLPTSKHLNQRGRPLPNDGRFTVYDYTIEGGVPSLMAGSPEEWDRIANMVIDENILSDMYALIYLQQNDPGSYILMDKVLKGHLTMKETNVTRKICEVWRKHMAVHMSHYAITFGKENGKLSGDTGPNARAQVATDLINEWISVCM